MRFWIRNANSCILALPRILLQRLFPRMRRRISGGETWFPGAATAISGFPKAMANYCALMMLQEKNPGGIPHDDGGIPPRTGQQGSGRTISRGCRTGDARNAACLFSLRRKVTRSSPTGAEPGCFTCSGRCSRMRRAPESKVRSKGNSEEPFVRALRRVRQRYEGGAISTRELMDVFAEELPPSLRYEQKNSLDWFLEGWVNGISLPRFELKGVKFSPKGSGVTVTGTILQKQAPSRPGDFGSGLRDVAGKLRSCSVEFSPMAKRLHSDSPRPLEHEIRARSLRDGAKCTQRPVN